MDSEKSLENKEDSKVFLVLGSLSGALLSVLLCWFFEPIPPGHLILLILLLSLFVIVFLAIKEESGMEGKYTRIGPAVVGLFITMVFTFLSLVIIATIKSNFGALF